MISCDGDSAIVSSTPPTSESAARIASDAPSGDRRTARGARLSIRDVDRPLDRAAATRSAERADRSDLERARRRRSAGSVRDDSWPPASTSTSLPPIDVVLLSHNHYDHLDAPTVRRIASRVPERGVAVPTPPWRALRSFGVRHVTECDWWQRWRRRPSPRCARRRGTSARDGFAIAAKRSGAAGRSPRTTFACFSPATRRCIPSSARSRVKAGSVRPRDAADRRVRAALVHARAFT